MEDKGPIITAWKWQRTPEVANKVVEFHLAFRFDALIVQVCIQHDNGKREKKYGVGPTKPARYIRVIFTVTACKCLHHSNTQISFIMANTDSVILF